MLFRVFALHFWLVWQAILSLFLHFQPMKWEWYMISLIKYIDIYDKRLCGKAGFHYLCDIYKINRMRKRFPMHKKSNGHEIKHVIGGVILFLFRPPKVGLFQQKRSLPWLLLMFCTTQQGPCLWFALGISLLCYLPHHQSLSPFCYRKLSSHFFLFEVCSDNPCSFVPS